MKILIIDDSPTEVHIVRSILDKQNHEIVVAENGEMGVEKAKADKPDLIIMDVVMPGMNGFQATRALSKDESTANIPVIMLTTKDTETDKIWAMRQGATDYLVKPVTEKNLLSHIKKAIG